MDPRTSGERAGGMAKERCVVVPRLDGLSMLVGMPQDLVACDDATFDFIQNDVPPEFDLGPPFVSRNGAGVRFKEAQYFLFGGNFFPLEDPPTRLRDHLFHQREDLLGLCAQSRGLPL